MYAAIICLAVKSFYFEFRSEKRQNWNSRKN
jgi:hypothetical protein